MRIVDSFHFGVYDNPLATRYATARSCRTGAGGRFEMDIYWLQEMYIVRIT